jgi:FtsZ-interacting cell division protein ZipA
MEGGVAMDNLTVTLLVVGVVVIVAIVVAAWIYMQRRRTTRLRSRFGPEYDRTVRAEGDSRHAERVLEKREKRIESFELKPLSDEQRKNYARAWQQEQARFVDQPREAVKNANRLVTEVMKARGYPMGDFEQRAADVSVDHPVVVENYRVAHSIAVRDSSENVGTEALREAMIHYRALFADLLHDGGTRPVREVAAEPESKSRAKEAGR